MIFNKFGGIVVMFISLATQTAFSMPAKRTPISGQMADGTPVEAVLHGDENFHYYTSVSDGSLLMRQGDTFVYADIEPAGKMVVSSRSVKAASRVAELNDAANEPRRLPGLVPGSTFPSMGEHKVAVVLVEYQDVKFNLKDPLDYFTRLLNEEGFSDYWATGSARDWYIHSSCAQFIPEFVVMGPVTLSKPRYYYGENDAWGQDVAPQKMVIEACRQLNPTVDFKEFDRDNDGYIDNVFVVYAGQGEASGGSSECVWPHSWSVIQAEQGSSYIFDNVRLDKYACVNEWELSDLGRGYRPVGIGSFVHEFAHVMGLPDLYSTQYVEETFTLGEWSVMDYGPYNNDMCTPPQFSAWERAALGYMTPKELTADAANVALEPFDTDEAYIINTSNPNEFFILENRQQQGWDTHIPGHGMLVWHIDYDDYIWRINSANNDPRHYYIDILEADDIESWNTRDGDCFPGVAGVTALSSKTKPALQPWTGETLPFSLTDITEIGTRIAFRLNGGTPDPSSPGGIIVSDINPASFTISWQGVEDTKGYRVKLGQNGYDIAETYVENNTCYTFSGLNPATEYSVSIAADDGCYGSPYTEPILVTTADPTLDYFTPVVLEATEVEPTSFVANWQLLDGATTYMVELFEQGESESIEINEDFSGDIENLQSGWTTSSRVTYQMASYAGEEMPSLRLASDGDVLVISKDDQYISSLSFWHRGNGTSEQEQIFIDVLDNVDWTPYTSFGIVTEKGGATLEIPFDTFTYNEARIRFSRPAKGSLAIDDVTARFNSPVDVSAKTLTFDANTTSCLFEGLTPGASYKFSVKASDGIYTSKESERISVFTPLSSALDIVDCVNNAFRVNGRKVYYPCIITAYDIKGAIVSQGANVIELPSTGVYIISAEGLNPTKIIITH